MNMHTCYSGMNMHTCYSGMNMHTVLEQQWLYMLSTSKYFRHIEWLKDEMCTHSAVLANYHVTVAHLVDLGDV